MIYNINPKKWGKHFWKTIHYIIFSAPDSPSIEYKNNLLNFLVALKFLLPCENCRRHYSENLKKFPITDEILSSKEKLIKWSVDLHNEVNLRTGKKIISLEEAKQIYLNENYVDTKKSIFTIVLLIILLLIIIYHARTVK